MATELVREILRRLGETASIRVVPWARGYQMVQRTPGTGLFATIRSAQREADFKWVGPIILAEDAYYSLKGAGLKIDQPQQPHLPALAAGRRGTRTHPVPRTVARAVPALRPARCARRGCGSGPA